MPFYPDLPTPQVADPFGRFAQGFGTAQDMQTQALKQQQARMQMQQMQQQQAALAQYGQSGDPTALRGVDPEMAAKLKAHLDQQSPPELERFDKLASFMQRNRSIITPQTWPQIKKAAEQSGVAKPGELPDNPSPQQLQQMLYMPELIQAHIKQMSQGPKVLQPGAALVGPTGDVLAKAPERQTTILGAGGEYQGTVSGPVKVMPRPEKPTLLQNQKGQLVPWYPGMSTEGLSKPTVSSLTDEYAGDLVAGLKDGTIAPSMPSKRGQDYNKLLALTHRSGINLEQMEIEYQGAKKFTQSLNSQQMVRFQGLGKSVVNTIDEIRGLSKQMQLSGVQALNKAELMAYIQTAGNTPGGQLATRYVAATNTLKEEFANLAMGGYAPTEPAFALANKQINENFGMNQMDAGLTEVQRLINYRLNAFKEIQPIRAGGGGGGEGGGHVPIGKTPDGRPVYRGPDGQNYVEGE